VRTAGSARDRGSAPVEFALVSVLVVALLLAVLQLGLALHVRNTLEAAASDGARYGAAAGRRPADAAARTRALAREALSSRFADQVDARTESVDGLPVMVVEVRGRLPVLGLWAPVAALDVRAHAVLEQP